jgi:predicted nucleic acid-binding protein
MLSADTSSLIAYLTEEKGRDVDLIEKSIISRVLLISPVVITELLSYPAKNHGYYSAIKSLNVVPLIEGFWERAGLLRAAILQKGYKARLGDILVAQTCLDHNLSLITRDKDFRHFVKYGGLKIVS